MVQVPDDAVEIEDDTVTVRLKNIPVVDSFTFYDPFPPTGHVPALTSFEMSYRKSGPPRRVRPTSADPASPFNWAGEMWTATGRVTFSVDYKDGSFSVHGTANSSGLFGEIGTEQNGVLLREEKD